MAGGSASLGARGADQQSARPLAASRIQGTVDWTEENGNQYTRFNGSLASENLGRSLSAWGLPEMIESDDANAKVSLGWPQWPLAPDYLALDGQARVDIGECRIPDTDTKTSFLRLLGVLNLGTIQRRLRLDFSDLYKKGLSCDSISGDFAMRNQKCRQILVPAEITWQARGREPPTFLNLHETYHQPRKSR